MAKSDYYEVLGIKKDASADEIKSAFRKAATIHHPDRGGDEVKFKEVNEAYEVLKDPEKRKRYDQFGHAGVGNDPNAGFGGGGFNSANMNFDFGDLGLGDIFSSFFGGGFNGAGERQSTRGRDSQTSVEVDFSEAIFGCEVPLTLNQDDTCSHCKGSTAEPGYDLIKCPTCDGRGQVVNVTRTIFGDIQQASVCNKCRGTGKVPKKECTACKGKGVQRSKQEIKLKVPAGIEDGTTIRLREHGEAIANGPKGDLYILIRVKPDKKFTREGDLILSEEHVSMVDAALGCELEVETVDGPLVMKVPAGTQSGSDFKLSNHGVPHLKGSSRGAHIVSVIVDIPTKLSKNQIDLLRQF